MEHAEFLRREISDLGILMLVLSNATPAEAKQI